MKTIDQLITEIIAREGGSKYTNRKNDKGGPTKYGVTQKTLNLWRSKTQKPADSVKNLQEREAREIYLEMFIREPGYEQFEDGALIEQLIDTGVNHGPGGAIRILQRALGVFADGVAGPKTLAAYKAQDPEDVVLLFIAKRNRAYAAICVDDHSQWENAAGWMNRNAEMLERHVTTRKADRAAERKSP